MQAMGKVLNGRMVCDGEGGLIPHYMRDGPQEYVLAEIADKLLQTLKFIYENSTEFVFNLDNCLKKINSVILYAEKENV